VADQFCETGSSINRDPTHPAQDEYEAERLEKGTQECHREPIGPGQLPDTGTYMRRNQEPQIGLRQFIVSELFQSTY